MPVVQALIYCNSEEPGRKLRFSLETLGMVPYFHKDFLGNLFCIIIIPHVPVDYIKNRLLVFLYQSLKSIFIPLHYFFDRLCICIFIAVSVVIVIHT